MGSALKLQEKSWLCHQRAYKKNTIFFKAPLDGTGLPEHLSVGLTWSGSTQLFKGPLRRTGTSPPGIPRALPRAWHGAGEGSPKPQCPRLHEGIVVSTTWGNVWGCTLETVNCVIGLHCQHQCILWHVWRVTDVIQGYLNHKHLINCGVTQIGIFWVSFFN